jgi:hypothetical protein
MDRAFILLRDALSYCRRDKSIDWEYVRIHDSGDFHIETNLEYGRLWIRLASAYPDIKFLAYTRCGRTSIVDLICELNSLPNMIIRPSEYDVTGLAALSAIIDPAIRDSDQKIPNRNLSYYCKCPKTFETGSCRECRVCWNDPGMPVAFLKHGVINKNFFVSPEDARSRRARIAETIGEPIENTVRPGYFFCTCCQKEKPLDEFGKNRHRKNGKSNYCKDCMSAREEKRKKI